MFASAELLSSNEPGQRADSLGSAPLPHPDRPRYTPRHDGRVAQRESAERCLHTAEATGSKPVTPTSTNSLLQPRLRALARRLARRGARPSLWPAVWHAAEQSGSAWRPRPGLITAGPAAVALVHIGFLSWATTECRWPVVQCDSPWTRSRRCAVDRGVRGVAGVRGRRRRGARRSGKGGGSHAWTGSSASQWARRCHRQDR